MRKNEKMKAEDNNCSDLDSKLVISFRRVKTFRDQINLMINGVDLIGSLEYLGKSSLKLSICLEPNLYIIRDIQPMYGTDPTEWIGIKKENMFSEDVECLYLQLMQQV